MLSLLLIVLLRLGRQPVMLRLLLHLQLLVEQIVRLLGNRERVRGTTVSVVSHLYAIFLLILQSIFNLDNSG